MIRLDSNKILVILAIFSIMLLSCCISLKLEQFKIDFSWIKNLFNFTLKPQEKEIELKLNLTESFSNYGFSFKYPENMEISEKGYIEPLPNEDSGSLDCKLVTNEFYHLCSIRWIKAKEIDPDNLLDENLKVMKKVADIVEGEKGKTKISNYNVTYQKFELYLKTEEGLKHLYGIEGAFYCQEGGRWFILTTAIDKEQVSILDLMEDYLNHFKCHIPESKRIKVKFLDYKNQQYGIKLKYPENWTKMENFMGMLVVFVSPSGDNVGLVLELLAENMTLQDYSKQNMDDLIQNSMITDVEILENVSTTLANMNAIKITFTGKLFGKEKLKWMIISAIKNGIAYNFIYTAKLDSFSEHLPLVERMLESFKVFKQPEIKNLSQQPETTYFLSYENKEHGIKILYPYNWEIAENFMGSIVIFRSPKENVFDDFQENVNIVVKKLEKNESLDELTKEAIEDIKANIPNAKFLLSKDVVINNEVWHKVVYTGKFLGLKLKWLQLWKIEGGKAYMITYTAKENNFYDYLPIVDKMINSFEIVKQEVSISETFSTYTDEKYGIKIDYPKDWYVSKQSGRTIVTFISLAENETDSYRENVKIIVKKRKEKDILGWYESYLSKSIKNIKIVDYENVTLSPEITGWKVVFRGLQRGTDLIFLEYRFLANDGLYVIRYSAKEGSYSKYLPLVDEMIKSLKIYEVKLPDITCFSSEDCGDKIVEFVCEKRYIWKEGVKIYVGDMIMKYTRHPICRYPGTERSYCDYTERFKTVHKYCAENEICDPRTLRCVPKEED